MLGRCRVSQTWYLHVQEYLNDQPAGEHAVLMLLDMDEFEVFNRKKGNIFADAVLQEVAGSTAQRCIFNPFEIVV